MQTRSILFASGGALCLIGALAFTVSVMESAYRGGRSPHAKRTAARAAPEPSPPSAEASEPSLGERSSRPAQVSVPASPSSASPPGAAEPAPEEPGGISYQQYHAFVDSTFERQAPDPAWSRDAALELTRSFLPLVEKDASRATRVECRRDLCRFEVRTRDEQAYDAAFNAALGQNVWAGGVMAARSRSEPTTLVVYVAKKGTGIPSPLVEEGML